MVTELTDETFAESLKSSPLAVVDFYAGWCGPCMMFKPKFARISGDYPHVSFFILDGEKAPESRKTVEIPSLPYFGIYKDGVFVEGFSSTKEEGFRETIEAHFGKTAEAS